VGNGSRGLYAREITPTLESRVTLESAGMKTAPTWKMEWQTTGNRGLYARGTTGQSMGNRNNLAAK